MVGQNRGMTRILTDNPELIKMAQQKEENDNNTSKSGKQLDEDSTKIVDCKVISEDYIVSWKSYMLKRIQMMLMKP